MRMKTRAVVRMWALEEFEFSKTYKTFELGGRCGSPLTVAVETGSREIHMKVKRTVHGKS